MTSEVTELSSIAEAAPRAVIFFWSTWHEATAPKGSTSTLYQALASATPGISFYRVEAEIKTDISSHYNVTVVPSFVFLNGGKAVQMIEGADDVAKLTQAVSALRNSPSTGSSNADEIIGTENEAKDQSEDSKEENLNKRLKSLISSSPVIIFMKGTAENPRCGFSRQAIELLTKAEISFATFDILSDDDVRQGLKKYSEWPTYPQLYANGELVGGLDIMKEMVEDADGEEGLAEALGVPKLGAEGAGAITSANESKVEKSLDERLQELVSRSKIMLFMKGLPSQPKCGFSRQICEILNEQKMDFDAFDILGDDEVRQGLKNFSDWPTFPQLYVDGDLIGGLDIVKEMLESDELKDLL